MNLIYAVLLRQRVKLGIDCVQHLGDTHWRYSAADVRETYDIAVENRDAGKFLQSSDGQEFTRSVSICLEEHDGTSRGL